MLRFGELSGPSVFLCGRSHPDKKYRIPAILKGTATLMISMYYQKEIYDPLILIQVSSKSVQRWASYGHLKNSIWPTFSRHFEHLISFQNFFYC